MLDLTGKTVALIGYGVANRALGEHLRSKGVDFVVRCPQECDISRGQRGIFGNGYLDTCEDVVFRSPGVKPSLIKGGGQVYTEAGYGLGLAGCKKIGITGSDGKTTTSTLIYQMLKKGNKNAFLCGNIGYPIVGVAVKASASDYMVAELSSFQLLDMTPELDVAAVTNVSQNHLDYHADMDEYIRAKKNIVKNAKVAVLNYDDPIVRKFECKRVIYFSLGNRQKEICSEHDLVHIVNGVIYYNGYALFPVSHILLRGDFNVQNVLCAIGCTYGIVGKDACHGVAAEFLGVGGRQEVVLVENGVTYINSAIDTTPSRTNSTLGAFDKKRVVAILGGYDKNLDYGALKDTLRDVKTVILCGENREKIEKAAMRRVINVNTLNEAVVLAKNLAKEGDFVILTPASASFDMFKNYKEKGICFAEAVKQN